MTQKHHPIAVVKLFLQLMEERDLQTAQELLAPSFKMVFPGHATPSSLADLVEWGSTRYRFVRKSFDHFDVCSIGSDQSIVYCYGTLYGEWLSGEAFNGIRFIDRFELVNLKLTHQSVWNDMALHQPDQTPTSQQS